MPRLLLLPLVWILVAATGAAGQTPASGDLDAFMEKVLARREVNRKALNDYVLDETETFEILGPGKVRLHRTRRDFTWYVRDGMHVRSPVRFNGVGVGPEDRDKYEREWIGREKARLERQAKREKEKGTARDKGEVTIGSAGVQVDTGSPAIPTEPRFVSEAYFMDFKFEPGNYYLAGREQLEGHEVLRIEYYPTRLFDDDDKKTPKEAPRTREQRRERDMEEKIDRQMNKTALITLWVDPANHQIVKYTFDNVWMDFLPGAWLVRVDDIRASMTMGQPFPGVWLPKEIDINAGVTLANGSFDASYARDFAGYREAEVKSIIRVPKLNSRLRNFQLHKNSQAANSQLPNSQLPNSQLPNSQLPNNGVGGAAVDEFSGGHGPYVDDDEAQQEVVREVRVHGNAFLSDDEILKIAGVAIGQPVEADAVAAVEKRLKASGRFETVQVRKRYRSLDDATDVALVLVVHEKPGVRSDADLNPVTGPFRRLKNRTMFLPILGYGDGYGFTYGARFSTVDLLGAGERLSVPLTWGGTRRAAIEFERSFDTGPLTRVTSSFGIWNRRNPRFEIRDQRVEFKARAERDFARVFRAGVETSRSTVSFATIDDDLWTVGTTGALDTRGDPAFPANAVYLGAGWTGLNVKGRERINRYTVDGRGYLRVVGQAVVAGRLQYFNSDATLPVYERLLLGGSPTLRGFKPGSFDGDRMLVTGAELRVPVTSVISGAKLGFSAFLDAARVTDFGARLDDAAWHKGVGGGVFIIAPLFKVNLDVAKGLNGGDYRVHLSSGFTF